MLWMLGMLAAYRVRPHLLADDRLRIRNGARTRVDVPLAAVATSRTVEHELPGIVRAVHHADGLLLVGVSSRTNLELQLTGLVLSTSKGDVTPIASGCGSTTHAVRPGRRVEQDKVRRCVGVPP